ncbi:zinc-binding alcohol dehydrogenase [Microbacterium sp. VKM Ac-2870]|uniref:zinc-binding alcohol dehydrogenase n=1 Tax=Microbacterium sp. VKM Ac-2870 TaxID=2783825 RepID=UPI00188C09B6|nr:zinc-binding alcohol dehydrogenase [Microbacterium sp. VKM Ac-2870]MBF4562707.1 zinc-binding alcohol dehydrogenase [Microbacterium sp. VKM Ac-2870]
MAAAAGPEWIIREDASLPVLVALYLRHVLGTRFPEELPHLRAIAPTPATTAGEYDDRSSIERQWRAYWDLTVEPQANPSPVPLELIDGFETYVALPVEGFAALQASIEPHAADAVAYARTANERYRASVGSGASYRAYASAIAEHERVVGRRAHSFELNVQVLPFTQRGVWWIGALTVAVTDGLRGDIAEFDAAIGPIIADIA